MNNTTEPEDANVIGSCITPTTIPFIGYLILGLVAFVTNFWMGATVLRNKVLRTKELLVFWGLTVGDMIFGFGMVVTGSRRLDLACHGRMSELVNISFCQREVHAILLLLGNQLSTPMMVLLSIDRLLAVLAYSFLMVSSAMMFSTISISTAMIEAAITGSDEALYPATCPSVYAGNPWFGGYHTKLNLVCSVVSIVIYCVVVLANFVRIMKSKNAVAGATTNQPSTTGNNLFQQQMKTQQRMTVTLGIISVCTFFFHTIPSVILVFGTYFQSVMNVLGPATGIGFSLNGCVNIFILAWRHKSVRAHLFCRSQTTVSQPGLQPPHQQ